MTTFSTGRRFVAAPEDDFAAIKDAARLAGWWGPAPVPDGLDLYGNLWDLVQPTTVAK